VPSTLATRIPAGTWTADKVHSTVGFAVKHNVVSTFRGAFADFEAQLVSGEDGSLRLEGRVPVDSIVVKDENLEAHLKSPEFFDVERHPDITFTSTLVRAEGDALVVDGDLTVKGRTRPIEGRGSLTEPTETPWGTNVVAIELEAVIDRTEYGLDWNAPLPKGGFVLANDVKLIVNLELVKA
jgi:polyisoprenoid-binding protein YceI